MGRPLRHRRRTTVLVTRTLLIVLILFAASLAKKSKPKSGGAGSRSGSGRAADSCLTKNPLIGTLKNNGVKVFTSPQASDASMCAAEWKTHNTCCDSASLVKYAERDIRQLENSISEVRRDVIKLNRALIREDDDIRKAVRGSKSGLRPSVLKELQADLDKLAKIVQNKVRDKHLSHDYREECFDRIKAIRTSSLCTTCSGRSPNFFLQGRALISMKDCRITLEKCGQVWSKSVDLIDSMTLAQKITKVLKSAMPKQKFRKFSSEEAQTMQDWLGHSEIRTHIEACRTGIHSCSDEAAKYLCETFISLKKNDFIEKAANMFSRNAQSLGEELVGAEGTKQSISNQNPNQNLSKAKNTIPQPKKQSRSSSKSSKSTKVSQVSKPIQPSTSTRSKPQSAPNTSVANAGQTPKQATSNTNKQTSNPKKSSWRLGRQLQMTVEASTDNTATIIVAKDVPAGHLPVPISTFP